MFPRFRNGYHNSKRKLHTAHHKKLKCIIKSCRIRTVWIDNRKNLVEIICKE